MRKNCFLRNQTFYKKNILNTPTKKYIRKIICSHTCMYENINPDIYEAHTQIAQKTYNQKYPRLTILRYVPGF